MKLDHIYVSVTDMDKSIKFYEELLELKITNRNENRWADFQSEGGFYLGLYNPKYDCKEFRQGNNTIGLKIEDIKKEY
ncbi:MAG TPA: hypothetical protein DEP72_08450 [Clostridiales bacterium]|nr:MAG: hypothetical protein A2Y18_07365 [Clostridiales bacterium GWD2_32_19]HCC08167.1 hypothetical protein [Clostridiales bacterium]